jgi:molybdopterin/thiamine biosynthesis adenylyltransferase
MTDNPTNEWDRVERFLGEDALAQLAKKSVAIVGLGSGGGFVALSMAMSGVGKFVLIDDDDVELTNVVRHVADLRYVGRPKVEAVAELIKQRNPAAQVEAVVGRLEEHTDELTDVDLVVVGVDGELVKYAINEVCRAHHLTAIYAGVYERGEGGDVVIIYPDSGPCYACWARQLRQDVAQMTARETTDPGETELDYGMIGSDGTIKAEPALWLHVARVAGVQADMALNELLTGQPIHREYPANTVILANIAMEIFEGVTVPPYSAQWVNVERDPACMVCGKPKTSTLTLEAVAGDLMSEDADGSEDQEATQEARENKE